MLDPNYELQMLKQRLKFKNLTDVVIESICAEAANDIIRASTDLLADAMEEAVQAGADANSVEFISELKIVQNGSSFMVGTESRRHDFSEPPFPMLPKLLKNAKVAADGSQYKVIPLRQKKKGESSKLTTTTEAALAKINESRIAAKKIRDEMGDDYRPSLTPDALKGMSTFAALQAINDVRKAFDVQVETKSAEPVVAFRTASSKQSPNEKWVNPGKEVMMGNILHQINSKLQDRLDQTIMDVIRTHEDMY